MSNSTEINKTNGNGAKALALPVTSFRFMPSAEQVAIIKNQLCKDLSEPEFLLFMEVAKGRGLNPLLNQIYAIRRFNQKKNPKSGEWEAIPNMTIQLAIEGYILIAERTGRYRGCKTSTTGSVKDKTLIAKAIVYKANSEPIEVEIEWEEFAPIYKDKQGNEKISPQWGKMPKWMLQKVALARALSRAFPEDLSGLNTDDEMEGADFTAAAIEVNPINKGVAAHKELGHFEETKTAIEPLENPWLHCLTKGQERGKRICQADQKIFQGARLAFEADRLPEIDFVNIEAAFEAPHKKQEALDELESNDGIEALWK